jgi:hypothetical protein
MARASGAAADGVAAGGVAAVAVATDTGLLQEAGEEWCATSVCHWSTAKPRARRVERRSQQLPRVHGGWCREPATRRSIGHLDPYWTAG